MLATRLMLGMALALAAVAPGSAQSGGGLLIRKSVIVGGGGEVNSLPLRLTGTIGQHDAELSSNGPLVLRGGFWGAPSPATDRIFYNGFE